MRLCVDDDHIETFLSIRFGDLSDMTPEQRNSESPPNFSRTESDAEAGLSNHGLTLKGQVACCRKVMEGLVDCQSCIEENKINFIADLMPEDAGLVQRISAIVEQAGSQGVTKDQLLVSSQALA